ncbi:phage holin family protein [Scrofimicrobium sp. R131]|uniref:Phage holin family protein n=1 Tax=Scrofimicrobium appendicitidis TaxID=3079930 RepID=A0AAU7V943_9ACTO
MTQSGPNETLLGEEAIADALNQPPERASLFGLVSLAFDQAKTLLTTQIELAKLKVTKAAKKFGAGAGLAVVGLILLFYFIFWFFRTIEMLFLLIVPAWAASLITLGIILLLMILLISVGALLINRGTKDVPDVGGEIQANVDAVKEGLGK